MKLIFLLFSLYNHYASSLKWDITIDSYLNLFLAVYELVFEWMNKWINVFAATDDKI